MMGDWGVWTKKRKAGVKMKEVLDFVGVGEEGAQQF